MKFSFNLIKKLAPGKYTKSELVEKLNLHSFETVDLGGDVLEVALPANRYSDAASHLGIAREAAVIFGSKLNDPTEEKLKYDHKDRGVFRINVKEKNLCRRYLAAYAADVKVGPSPKWLKGVLETCGLRSINNVVDIMNYVMLELGQPLHAFDADKVSGGLVIRRAQKGESITTIDGQKFNLDSEVLVIADAKQPLAIAGIKGGNFAEVSAGTKRILVEAAHFDGGRIYKTSRKLGLQTDASIRFSHSLSPELSLLALNRALILLREITGATLHAPIDVYSRRQAAKLLPFNFKKIRSLIGQTATEKPALATLAKLGFKKRGRRLEVPALRMDVENPEDVAEEISRFSGYNNLVSQPPAVALKPAVEGELLILKDQLRKILTGAGFSEVYNYSLAAKEKVNLAPKEALNLTGASVELANPISGDFALLRDSLAPALLKNLEDNLRFFDEVRIFEIGNLFSQAENKVSEITALGIALSPKNGVLELKGLADILFQRLGLTDYFLPDLNLENKLLKSKEALRIESGNHEVLGYLGTFQENSGAVLEINLNKLLEVAGEEKEYESLPKFPAIARDLSVLVPEAVRVGEILDLIQRVSSKLVRDVDLIDFYEPPAELHPKKDRSEMREKRKSLTFRIVFQAEDRTLTDAEADREMAVINQVLIDKFDVELR